MGKLQRERARIGVTMILVAVGIWATGGSSGMLGRDVGSARRSHGHGLKRRKAAIGWQTYEGSRGRKAISLRRNCARQRSHANGHGGTFTTLNTLNDHLGIRDPGGPLIVERVAGVPVPSS